MIADNKKIKTTHISLAHFTWIFFHLVQIDLIFLSHYFINFQCMYCCFEKIYIMCMHGTFSISEHRQCPSYWTVHSGRHCGMRISRVGPSVYCLSYRTMEGHSDSESNAAKNGRHYGDKWYCTVHIYWDHIYSPSLRGIPNSCLK